MEIRYDKEADALYIELQKGEFEKNKKIDGIGVESVAAVNTFIKEERIELKIGRASSAIAEGG